MTVPSNLHYTKDHEWADFENPARVRIGLTDFAQKALGDIVFVELPKINTEVKSGDMIGEVESTKSVSEIYSPANGKVIEVNDKLSDTPEVINTSPYTEGWVCVLDCGNSDGTDGLLSSDEYSSLIQD